MRDDSLSKALSLLLAVALAVLPTRAHASIFGEENIALTTLVAQGASELTQLGNAITTAKEQLQLARDVYAGVNEFLNFDPQAFLEGQRQQWMSDIPLANEVQGFVSDVSANGLRGGHFSAQDVYQRFDTYRDAARRAQARRALGGTLEPFDARAALSLSREADTALASAHFRQQLAQAAEPATLSEGLFASDAARADPQLLALYVRRRAAAKEAEYQAFKLLSESMGATPGKAQQLAAMATGLSAQELARIDEKLGQSLSLQELQHTTEATTRATERLETDFLWKDIERGAHDTFQPPQRSQPTWEEL
jgi:hypothetical protein